MTDVQPATATESQTSDGAPRGVPATRRLVLAGAGAAGVTVVLAGCGSDNGGGAAPEPPAGSAPASGGTGGPLATTAEVPVNGGIIKGDFVITQPSEGTFKAFTKICTHQGCPVTEIAGGTINCKCHGSQFSIEDGSVKGGPAPKPLPETAVKLDGDNIVAA